MEEKKMSYLEHLDELRWRLIYSFLAIFLATMVCFLFAEKLFKLLINPLLKAMPEAQQQLIYTNLPEAFVAYLKVAFVAGLFISSPFVLYQVWKFISPGLYKHEKRYAFPFVFFSSFFFMAGGFFCFYQVFPWGFRFFLSFSNEYIVALPKMSEYISFSLKLLVVFGLVFQLPILIYFLTKIGVVNSHLLVKNRKYAILVVFILAAILTPPDVVTQIMLAIPLIFLYEVSIVLAKIVDRNKKRAKEQESRNEEEKQEADAAAEQASGNNQAGSSD